MKVRVDRATCSGHARCNATAPGIYEIDAMGYCAITELTVPEDLEELAEKGAAACPERAITVER
jgi:ferredoxin